MFFHVSDGFTKKKFGWWVGGVSSIQVYFGIVFNSCETSTVEGLQVTLTPTVRVAGGWVEGVDK